MAKSKQPRKCRNFMYEQQVCHLPNNMSVDDIYNHIEQTLKPKRMAMALHDKDLKDDNITPAEAHIHIMLQFENARSVNQVAKEIGDNPQQLVIWNGHVENGFSYLCHRTKGCMSKYQYPIESIRANFDYGELIERVTRKVVKSSAITSTNRINYLLDAVASGEIPLADAKNQLTGSEYAKACDKLKKAHELFLERSADKLHKQMIENDVKVEVHWFYGESETGKSFLAEQLAKDLGVPYYKTTTTKDPFQFYQAEQTVILDELRPDVIPYSELLTLLDPFSRGKVTLSSRYFNKAISCKTIFITTPYDPVMFYMGYNVNTADKGEQLYRRLSSVLEFDMNNIYKMEYRADLRGYLPVSQKTNNYSRKKQQVYTLGNVFDKIEGKEKKYEVRKTKFN